jgi:TetR/AcrR family tetracycline transcriptional repressor
LPRRPLDPRAKLTRGGVIAKARELLQRDGIAGLTMRRLAAELDVAPRTLYTYVRDKDDLLGAVVEEVVREFPAPPRRGSWKTQMRQLMRTLHGVLVANPFIVDLRRRGPIVGQRQLRLNELGLQILIEGGFSESDAAFGYRSLLVMTFGFAAFGPPAESRLHERTVDAALAALPAGEFPYLRAARAETVATHAPGSALYDFLLERALDGLEPRARRKSK